MDVEVKVFSIDFEHVEGETSEGKFAFYTGRYEINAIATIKNNGKTVMQITGDFNFIGDEPLSFESAAEKIKNALEVKR